MNPHPAGRRKAAAIDPIVVADCESSSRVDSRQEHIATAAYYKAEARSFVHGMDLQDWLDAEAEFDTAQGRQP